jgi:hypothetical protein
MFCGVAVVVFAYLKLQELTSKNAHPSTACFVACADRHCQPAPRTLHNHTGETLRYQEGTDLPSRITNFVNTKQTTIHLSMLLMVRGVRGLKHRTHGKWRHEYQLRFHFRLNAARTQREEEDYAVDERKEGEPLCCFKYIFEVYEQAKHRCSSRPYMASTQPP